MEPTGDGDCIKFDVYSGIKSKYYFWMICVFWHESKSVFKFFIQQTFLLINDSKDNHTRIWYQLPILQVNASITPIVDNIA